MADKKITIKFTCPKLTGKKIHKVIIEDSSLTDTWDSVALNSTDGEYTHDLNAWADSLGYMDLVKVSVYPFITNEQGEIETDHCNPIRCRILDIKGDKNLSTRMFKSVKHWGYIKKALNVISHECLEDDEDDE